MVFLERGDENVLKSIVVIAVQLSLNIPKSLHFK